MNPWLNWGVISGLVLRYTYLYRRSVPRVLEMIFWPSMDLLVWGFVTRYVSHLNPGSGGAVTFLIGAMILWDVLYRSAQGVTMSFLEDLWSRNVLNVFVAPVRLREFITATFLVGVGKTGFIIVLLGVLSLLLYQFNLLSLGWALGPFFGNLVFMGWTIGVLTTALIMRYGQSVEALAWGVPFLIQPFACVFYPVSVLPAWMQAVAWTLPATPVFEGMRSLMRGGPFPWADLMLATGMNVFWFSAASLFLSRMHRIARQNGYLAKLGTQ